MSENDLHAIAALASVESDAMSVAAWIKRSPWVEGTIRPGRQVFVMEEEGASKAIRLAAKIHLTCARLRVRSGLSQNCGVSVISGRADSILEMLRNRHAWLFNERDSLRLKNNSP